MLVVLIPSMVRLTASLAAAAPHAPRSSSLPRLLIAPDQGMSQCSDGRFPLADSRAARAAVRMSGWTPSASVASTGAISSARRDVPPSASVAARIGPKMRRRLRRMCPRSISRSSTGSRSRGPISRISAWTSTGLRAIRSHASHRSGSDGESSELRRTVRPLRVVRLPMSIRSWSARSTSIPPASVWKSVAPSLRLPAACSDTSPGSVPRMRFARPWHAALPPCHAFRPWPPR